MSALWIVLAIVAVFGGMLFSGWVVVAFIEAIAKEVMKGLCK